MIQLFKMALRDLARNRRRSFFSALALGIGLALLLLIAATIAGEMRNALNSAIQLQSGHLQVRAKTYDETKTSLAWEDLIENPDQIAAQVAALAPVQVATPRLYASGIVAVGNDSEGVRILGIDPASPASDPYRAGVLSGAYLSADDRQGVLIGRTLADKFGVQPGGSVNILINTSNGDVDTQSFVVRGIYSTRTQGLDEITVLMPLAKAQTFARAESHASVIFVLLKDQDQTNAVVTALQSSPYQVLTFAQMNELLIQTEDMANSFMIIVYLIVLAITATVIVNTLIMAVFERTREIGILSAMGMKSASIMSMFFAESVILAVGGIAIGLVVGGLMVWYASTIGFALPNMGLRSGLLLGEVLYAYFVPSDFIELTVLAFIVTLLAALYPAMLAARMEPVQALRGGK